VSPPLRTDNPLLSEGETGARKETNRIKCGEARKNSLICGKKTVQSGRVDIAAGERQRTSAWYHRGGGRDEQGRKATWTVVKARADDFIRSTKQTNGGERQI